MQKHFMLHVLIAIILYLDGGFCDNWQDWWTYDGISGPRFWGLLNPEWNMCTKGRRQSPINIEPEKLLFDPSLRPLSVDKHEVSGYIYNTGQSVLFRVDKDTIKHCVNISGGPLAYRYQFDEIYIHYGIENSHGSEHRIHGYSFPGEIQLYGFNKDLYHNMTEARYKPQGIIAISIMIQVGENTNREFQQFTSRLVKIQYKGTFAFIEDLSIKSLLPNTDEYMTYEGSITYPGCWETAIWIIINKPIYISKQQLYVLRKLMQGSQNTPKAPLGNNIRPVQPLNFRTVRTNIDFDTPKFNRCFPFHYDIYYKANKWNSEDEPENSENVG